MLAITIHAKMVPHVKQVVQLTFAFVLSIIQDLIVKYVNFLVSLHSRIDSF